MDRREWNIYNGDGIMITQQDLDLTYNTIEEIIAIFEENEPSAVNTIAIFEEALGQLPSEVSELDYE